MFETMWSSTQLLGTIVLFLILPLAVSSTEPASASEVDKIAEVLSIGAGMRVADVGAGDGEWAIAIARQVGGTGHVFATEVDEDELQKIETRIERAQLSNITVVLGDQVESGLPDACCDAVLLRMVYHHFVNPTSMLASLRRAMLPDALLAVIDITPQENWRQLQGVPDRGGHGIPPADLIEEITRHGFELVASYSDWNDDPERFCVVVRRSSSSDP